MVAPICTSPASGFISPIMILQSVLLPTPLWPMMASLSPFSSLKLKFSNITLSSNFLLTFLSSISSLPISRFARNRMLGSRLLETAISAISNFSSCFAREVACFALLAFAENLAINFSSSSFSFSFLSRSISCCFAIKFAAIYQSS